MKHFFSLFLAALAVAPACLNGQNGQTLKQYDRKIFFSNAPVATDPTGSPITTYTRLQPLYARFFIDSTLKQFQEKYKINDASKVKALLIKFYFNNKFYYQIQKPIHPLTDADWNSAHSFEVVLAKEKNASAPGWDLSDEFSKFTYLYKKNLESNPEVKMEFYMFDGYYIYQLYATGLLQIKSVKEEAKPYQPPTQVINDPVLAGKITKAFNSQMTGHTVKKVYLETDRWDVVKNEATGAILKKRIIAVLYVQDPDGCHYEASFFDMDHEGGGKYGPVYYYGLTHGLNQKTACGQ